MHFEGRGVVFTVCLGIALVVIPGGGLYCLWCFVAFLFIKVKAPHLSSSRRNFLTQPGSFRLRRKVAAGSVAYTVHELNWFLLKVVGTGSAAKPTIKTRWKGVLSQKGLDSSMPNSTSR